MMDKTLSILFELISLAQREPGLGLLQFRSLISAHQYRLLYELTHRFIPFGSQVLDWGVGNGHFSYYLMRAGYATTGYSFTPCGLQDRLFPDGYRLIQGDVNEPVRLPFEDYSFDAVVSVGVLEHVRETGGEEIASLKEIRRILKPGGRFICYHFPNHSSLVEALARCFATKHHHPYRFTRRDIQRLLQTAELNLLETRRYGGLPRNIWHAAPSWLCNSPVVALGWNGLDHLFDAVLSPLCQNHQFVAQRPH